MNISGMKDKCNDLLDHDIIGKELHQDLVDLLDYVDTFGSCTMVRLTVDVLDNLLGELEQERAISDAACFDLGQC